MELLRTISLQSFAVFVELNWQVTILAVVIGLASLLSRKTSSNFRYWLWCILLVRLCLPVNLSLPYGLGDDLRTLLLSIPEYFSPAETLPTAPEAGDPALFQIPLPIPPAPMQFSGIAEENPAPVVPAEPVVTAAPPLSWAEIVMAAWGGIVLLLGSLIGWWLWRVRRILRQAAPVERPELQALLEKLHKNLGLRRPVRLCSLDSSDFFGPAVVGLLRPTIYIPLPIANDWPVEEIEPILLHELVHVKRGDLLVNWLQILAQAAWFFHPLVWLANQQIRKLREDICDDVAIRNLDTDRRRYTGNMLRVVKAMNSTPAGSLLMLGFTETQKSLTRRVMRIMSDTYRNHPRLTRLSTVLLIILAAGGFALASGNSRSYQDDQVKINKDDALFERETLRQASRYYQDGLYEKAIAEYEKALESITSDDITFKTIGFSHEEFRKRSLFKACLNLSHSYSETGNEDKSRDLLIFAVKNFDFDDNYTKLYLAAQHCQMNDVYPDLAWQWAQEICEMSGWERAGALVLYKTIAVKQEKYDAAIDACHRLLRNPKGNPYSDSKEASDFSLKISLAGLTIAAGDTAKGEQLLEDLIDESQGIPERLCTLASTILEMKRVVWGSSQKPTLDDAIEWARNTIAVTQDHQQQARYLGLLAALLFEKGDAQDAVKTLEHALKFSPDNAALQRRLENYQAVQPPPSNTSDNAQIIDIQDVTISNQTTPPSAPSVTSSLKSLSAQEIYDKAYNYYRHGAHKTALRYFDRLLINFGESEWIPDAQFYKARTHEKLKQYEDAARMYQMFLDGNPAHENVSRARTSLARLVKRIAYDQGPKLDIKVSDAISMQPENVDSTLANAEKAITAGYYTVAWQLLSLLNHNESFSTPEYSKTLIEYYEKIPVEDRELLEVQTFRRKLPFLYYKSGQERKGREELERILLECLNFHVLRFQSRPMDKNNPWDRHIAYNTASFLLSQCARDSIYIKENLPWAEMLVEAVGKDFRETSPESLPTGGFRYISDAYSYALLAHASLLEKTGTYGKAISALETAVTLDNNSQYGIRAFPFLAKLYNQTGEESKADALLPQLAKVVESNPILMTGAVYGCSEYQVFLPQAAEWARLLYEQETDPDKRINAVTWYAAILKDSGDISEAIEVLEEALDSYPGNFRLQETLEKIRGTVTVPVKTDGQAQIPLLEKISPTPDPGGKIPITELEAEYNANPNNNNNTLAYAERLSRIGRNREALPIFEKLLAEETEPEKIAQLYGWLGRAYFAVNQYDRAIEIWKEALASSMLPDNFDDYSVMYSNTIAPHSKLWAYVVLARHSRYSKNDAAYIEYCSKIPDSTLRDKLFYQLTTWLPFAHLRLGHVERGREELLRLVKRYRNAPFSSYSYLMDMAGHCLETETYVPDILPAVKRAYQYKFENNDRATHIALDYARLLMKNGQIDQARNILESAIDAGAKDYTLQLMQVALAIADELSGTIRPGAITLTAYAEDAQSDFGKLSAVFHSCRDMRIRPRQTLEWAARLIELADTDELKTSSAHRYASLLFENGETERAIEIMQDAVKQHPHQYRYHLDLERYRATVN